MSTYTEEVGNKLNELLEKTYDAEKGFKKASGFLRSSLASNLSLKRVPSLTFIYDELDIYD